MKIRPRAPIGALIDRQALAFAWRYLHPYRKRLAFHALGASIQSLLVLPVLALVRRAFDVSIPAGDVQGLILIGAAIFLLRGVASLVSLGLRSHVLWIVKGAITTLRLDVVGALLTRSRRDLDAIDPADTQTRLVQDTERSDRVLNTVLSSVLPAFITFAALTIVLLVLEWRLVILGLVVVPLLWFASRAMGRVVEREMKIFQKRFERFSKGIHFILRQMDLVRLTAAETMELARQQKALEDLRDSGHKMAMTFAVHTQLQRTLTGLAGIVLLVGGGIGVALETLTIGEFVTFYVAAGMLSGSINSILGGFPEMVAGNVSLLTLKGLLEDAEREPYTGHDAIRFEGRIEFQDVHFGYGDSDILRGVTLEIVPGEHVAITGPNGAGKSTMAHLIAGFYRPRAGHLIANDMQYETLNIPGLRRQIGFVPQHPSFFVGTVRDNITYGRDAASPEALEEAVRLSHADDVIARLPLGYETPVGEGGVTLSGGERQRLAIARALLGSPRLLILDEPTTHLDAEHVQTVMADLTSLADRPTVLMISHDPQVVALADTVYRLEAGHIQTVTPHVPALDAAG